MGSPLEVLELTEYKAFDEDRFIRLYCHYQYSTARAPEHGAREHEREREREHDSGTSTQRRKTQ